jgi:hypothetical protein
MKPRIFSSVCLFVGLAIFLTLVVINYLVIAEAFGQGPPYYARTTNMDKWTNPLPTLVAIDIAATCVVALLIRLGGKKVAVKSSCESKLLTM